MFFDRKKFFDGYRREFGSLSQSQVNGLNELLTFIERDRYVKTVEVGGFLLGTTKHETADTFKPIHEYGGKAYFIKRYGGQTRKGKELGNDTPEEGYDYAGKGYPQTTGESNYERLEDALKAEYPEVIADFEKRTGRKFDLTVGDQPNDKADPQNMLDPAIAYVSMSYGSRVGLFTTKKLSDYNLSTFAGRKASRRIINGQDKATLIAGYIGQFAKILAESQTKSNSAALAGASVNQPETNAHEADTANAHAGDASSQTQPPINSADTPTTETVTMAMPTMKRAWQWLGTGAITSAFGTGYAALSGLEPWQVFALGMLTGMFLTALVVLGWQNRKYLFSWLTEIAKVNADPTTNNIEVAK